MGGGRSLSGGGGRVSFGGLLFDFLRGLGGMGEGKGKERDDWGTREGDGLVDVWKDRYFLEEVGFFGGGYEVGNVVCGRWEFGNLGVLEGVGEVKGFHGFMMGPREVYME